MAAIDKLYLGTYNELSELRQWALAYYPRLVVYFYDWAFNVTKKEFDTAVTKKAKETLERYKQDWDRISPNGTISCAVAHIMSDWGWQDEKDATEEANSIRDNAHKTLSQVKDEVTFPVMMTPTSVDRKLKWICPLPSIRLYLQGQCGMKEHWYYKIFWRGRKEFHYYF